MRISGFQGPRLWKYGGRWSQETCTDPVAHLGALRHGMVSLVQEGSP